MNGGRSSDERPADPQPGRRRWGRAQLDHIDDPYKKTRKPHEPSVCPQCNAIYRHGRWQWGERPEHAESLLCQACHRSNDHYPAGIVTLTGPLVTSHPDEITQLVYHQENIEKTEHPLNRIMRIAREAPDRLVIETTDIHLPRRIGEAMVRAYRGAVTEHFEEDGYFIRVTWTRPH